MATEGTVIKMCEGVHMCRATIRQGGIKIEPYYKDRLVYLLGNEGPTLKVDVPMEDPTDYEEATKKQVIMKRIVLSHNGEAIVKRFKELQLPKIDLHKKPNIRVLEDMSLDPDMNTIMIVESGSVLLRNCLFSLRALPKDLTRQVPAFVALPGTHVTIVNCDFMGNGGNITTALVFVNTITAIISLSRFARFKGGAVYSLCQEK